VCIVYVSIAFTYVG